jgi:thiamine biosynthesis lipoprotein
VDPCPLGSFERAGDVDRGFGTVKGHVDCKVDRWSFRAMGTTVRVATDGGTSDGVRARAASAIVDAFAEEERRFSRFRVDSELSRVNASAGKPVRVSPTFAEVLELALEAAAQTEGLFDPTVLDALLAAGYDRDFDELIAGARGALHPVRPCGRWNEVRLDRDVVELPRGVGLDLGGLAKGWTADLAASRAVDTGQPWTLVNAGGDLAVAGRAPRIAVAVEDPDDPTQELGRLHVEGGGLATSSIRARAWGDGMHHVIDPRTGVPASTALVQATAAAGTCARAEIAAKAILLGGPDAAAGAAVTVWADGCVRVHVPVEDAA